MTIMAREIESIPGVVRRQIDQSLDRYLETGAHLRERGPAAVVTCARGSSDHAATYFKYLVETRIGIPVGSIGPSVASVYEAQLSLRNTPVVTISQSGASSDLLALQHAANKTGALTIALTNTAGSPLAEAAAIHLLLEAGPEQAVAATKTFIASLVALASIVAGWSADDDLVAAISDLPAVLESAIRTDWSAAIPSISSSSNLYVVSRGLAYAIAGEAALKLKETCRLHAEAYSAAELHHGPIELAASGLTALAFSTRDKSDESIRSATSALRKAGAEVFVAGATDPLPTTPAAHVALDPVSQIASFYKFVEQMSVSLGRNPDKPSLLSKVTVTT